MEKITLKNTSWIKNNGCWGDQVQKIHVDLLSMGQFCPELVTEKYRFGLDISYSIESWTVHPQKCISITYISVNVCCSAALLLAEPAPIRQFDSVIENRELIETQVSIDKLLDICRHAL